MRPLARDAAIAGVIAVGVALLAWRGSPGPASAAVIVPSPTLDSRVTPPKGTQTAVFAGGCFWGIEAVYEHVKGVTRAVSGYAGGNVVKPDYEQVSSGRTGHAEAVEVTFDTSVVSYGQLRKVVFPVAHDPTELNRQGPDVGTQYRSAIFYANDEQKRIAEAYIDQLTKAKTFPRPIVTQVAPLKTFYPAEDYHQDYLVHHMDQPYIVINDLPKLDHLKQRLPELYRR